MQKVFIVRSNSVFTEDSLLIISQQEPSERSDVAGGRALVLHSPLRLHSEYFRCPFHVFYDGDAEGTSFFAASARDAVRTVAAKLTVSIGIGI